MSVDTKGLVATPVKDVFIVSEVISRVIDQMVREGREKEFPGAHPAHESVKTRFSPANMRLSVGGMVSFDFLVSGQSRSLKAFFDCDEDYKSIAPQSIGLMIGCWGASEEIMRRVLSGLAFLGPTYIDVNDSDDVGLDWVPDASPTVLDAMAQGVLTPYSVEGMMDKFRDGKLQINQSFEEFFGISEDEVDRIRSIKSTGHRWDALTDHAIQSRDTSRPRSKSIG